MKKKIQRFFGLGRYFIVTFVYASWAACNACGTHMDICQVSTVDNILDSI